MGLPKTFLALGIAAVFAAFIAYGVNVVYEPPQYDYAQNDCYLKYDCYKAARECEKQYLPNTTTPGAAIPIPEPNDCNLKAQNTTEYKVCMKELDKCNEKFTKNSPQYSHARNTFFIMLFIGLAAIVAGSRITKPEGVGAGLIGGGVLVILFSIIQSGIYVYSLDKYIKLAGLGIALAVLIYVGYKRIDGKKE